MEGMLSCLYPVLSKELHLLSLGYVNNLGGLL